MHAIAVSLTLLALLVTGPSADVNAPQLDPTPKASQEPQPDDKKADDDEPKRPGPQPKFEKEENAATFEKGVTLFEDEKYKDARKAFKSAARGESKQTKAQVGLWEAACKGGEGLGKVNKAIDKAKWKEAWRQLVKVRARYGETPLEGKIAVLTETIEKELFLILATFEPDGPESEKNAGPRPNNAKIIDDKKHVSQGKHSLEWRPGRVGLGAAAAGQRLFGYLPISQLDGSKVEEYRYLHISFFATEKNSGRFTLFLDTGETASMNPLQTRSFYKHVMLEKPGWHHLRFDLLKDFASYTTPKMEEVQTLAILVIPPQTPKTIYIDDVKLEKK
ncbi:MAG: hypothetical protein AAF488_13380 [Planctomycetota bacterium]